ncbi:hypothetical protein E7T06_11380 [Deinococcus sp. Arct2-2]|uniref:hypothetical protein n=1 Tax=Deinococcus sp. Arct2-2 TaxID=2568653 RepID=UPI0010A59F05|nr:hypothetical protein [Deinococcus sp. Arct2-2]THF69609.1 hypothetical protein E7T06_11380 [Deinococcus sp. Arct2-2]
MATHPAAAQAQAWLKQSPTESRLTFGRRLREERHHDMTLEDIAASVGVPLWNLLQDTPS